MQAVEGDKIDKIVNLCSRRGIFFPTSEIYGAVAGFYDYGPIGVQLKRNVENSWWKFFITSRENMVGIDGAIITHPTVWKASGHVDAFNDPLVECKKCHRRFRADHLVGEKVGISTDGMKLPQLSKIISEKNVMCLNCGGGLTEPKVFGLMFKTNVGPIEDEKSTAYLRPETAQSIFQNFKNVLQTSRVKLPFGIGQIGKSFRNEIAPRNFIFRLREFSVMEIEFFVDPEKMNDAELSKEDLALVFNVLVADEQEKGTNAMKSYSVEQIIGKKIIKTKWHVYWMVQTFKWLTSLGLNNERLRLRQHVSTELSHYSSETWDFEYNFPSMKWKEIFGCANRGDFDLKQHQIFSKQDLTYFDEEAKKRFLPFVIEPAFGFERIIFAVLSEAFFEKEEKGEIKNILRLPSSIAPIQVAVFPLMKKDGLADKAREVFKLLQSQFLAFYDESGSIGKRYARVDEIGCPVAITVDYDTLKDDTVTIRDRDTGSQKREKVERLLEALQKII